MSSFEDVVAQVMKALVQGPIGAEDMNAGDEFVEQPREQYQNDEELDKSVVPQHYVPAYGRVQMLYKSPPKEFGRVIKADDVIKEEYTDREIIVAGYASPQVIDREAHLIQKEGMVKDLPRFLANPMFANAMILHSNVQVGVVLPEWTHPETGKTYKTSVDDIGLYVIIKIRTDKYRPKIVDKVIEDIEQGNLKAFSISGDAPVESREHKCADGQCFWVIPNIEFYEITICEEGVNQGAKLMILSKAVQGCPDGKCGLVRKQPIPEGADVLDEPNPTPDETIAKEGGIRALGEKAGIDWGAVPFSEKDLAQGIKIEMEHGPKDPATDVTGGDPVITAKIAWAHLNESPDYYKKLAEVEREFGKEDKDAEETKEELSERVGEVAENVGEDEAADMLEDAAEAAEKLEKVNVGSGVGSGGAGDANTMADFGKPYDKETATKGGDPLIDRFFQAYRTFLARGASPEDAYFKLLEHGADGEPAPPWFGTRDDKFRQFLIQAHHSGLPIPTVRLRMVGNKEGEMVADPSLTAWDLLQTAMNQMRGFMSEGMRDAVATQNLTKDVSPVAHAHPETAYTPEDNPDAPHAYPRDERAFKDNPGDGSREPTHRELAEPEEGEEYYLNLALKALGGMKKSASTLSAVAESKIHEAYTRAMDGIYRLGHLDREQRIALSSAITAALDAFHEEIGDIGDLELPAEDVALLMKARPRRDKCMKCDRPPTVEVLWAEGMARAWFCDACLDEWKKENGDDIVSEKPVEDGKVDKHCTDESHLHAPDFETDACGAVDKAEDWKKTPTHGSQQQGKKAPKPHSHGAMSHVHGPTQHYSGGGRVGKHRDKMGSTAHHKTGQPIGGIAQPPQTTTGQRDVPEQRYKTLLALVRERNQRGAKLRLNPGMRNKPYSVVGMDTLRRPVRLVGNVEEVTQALRENAQEVEAILEQQDKVDNYAVPVEVGNVNDVRIFEGDDVDPMEIIREQVAAASFESAVATVMKQPRRGWQTRDYLVDDKQQVEPANEYVQGGVRGQGGHANTQIISETDVQDIAGQPVEQAPPTHGIAQQGTVHPPRGVQGEGQNPEFVQQHEGEPEMRVENEGMPLAPEADEDNRGAPVAHRTRRP